MDCNSAAHFDPAEQPTCKKHLYKTKRVCCNSISQTPQPMQALVICGCCQNCSYCNQFEASTLQVVTPTYLWRCRALCQEHRHALLEAHGHPSVHGGGPEPIRCDIVGLVLMQPLHHAFSCGLLEGGRLLRSTLQHTLLRRGGPEPCHQQQQVLGTLQQRAHLCVILHPRRDVVVEPHMPHACKSSNTCALFRHTTIQPTAT